MVASNPTRDKGGLLDMMVFEMTQSHWTLQTSAWAHSCHPTMVCSPLMNMDRSALSQELFFESERAVKEKLLSLLGAQIAVYFPAAPIQHEAHWIDAVFENLRASVATGDTDAIEVACRLIEQDPTGLPFGKLIKSNLARALKKNADQISPACRASIIATTARLLKADHAPRELEGHAKLVKKFPYAEYADQIRAVMPACGKGRDIKKYFDVLGNEP